MIYMVLQLGILQFSKLRSFQQNTVLCQILTTSIDFDKTIYEKKRSDISTDLRIEIDKSEQLINFIISDLFSLESELRIIADKIRIHKKKHGASGEYSNFLR